MALKTRKLAVEAIIQNDETCLVLAGRIFRLADLENIRRPVTQWPWESRRITSGHSPARGAGTGSGSVSFSTSRCTAATSDNPVPSDHSCWSAILADFHRTGLTHVR
jgi:hypothetical protein